jgi:hypothetical protein
MKTLSGIQEHLKLSSAFRGAVVGLIGTVAVSVFAGVYSYGLLNKQVEINTEKWDRLERVLYKIEIHQGSVSNEARR